MGFHTPAYVVEAGLHLGAAVAAGEAGEASRDAYYASADVARDVGAQNVEIVERQEEQLGKVMGYEMGQFGRQAGRARGEQTSQIAASGITGGGSAQLLQQDMSSQLSMEHRNIADRFMAERTELTNRAALMTTEYEGEAANLESQGDLAKMQGDIQAINFGAQAAGATGKALEIS